MKILSLGNFSGVGWDGSRTDENHIAEALEELGHEVKRLQRGETIPLTNGEGPPAYDFILVAQFDGYDVEWLHKAKKYFMCPLIFWAYDFQEWGQQWCEEWCPQGLFCKCKCFTERTGVDLSENS